MCQNKLIIYWACETIIIHAHGIVSVYFPEVSFSECLFPVRIEVYEIFNPGAIVRILACDRDAGSDIDKGKIT